MMTICWNGRFYLSLETLDEKAAGLDFFGRGLNNVEHQPARKPVFFGGLEEDFGLPLVGLNRGDSERPGI